MTENEILGFDPSQLDALNQNETNKSAGNPLIYKTSPALSKSEDGRYRCTIKVVYNPFNLRQSVLEQQSYAMQDANGWFTVVSSLTNQDTSCPIFKAWKKCHFAKKDENYKLWKQAAKKDEGGLQIFDKRFARYVVVQVLEDNNNTEAVGKFLFWKMPKTVWDIIQAKMTPSAESKKAKIPVMDFLFGRAIDLEVIPGAGNPGDETYGRDTKYIAELSEDVVSCVNPDGSPLLNDNEQSILDAYVSSIKNVWKEKDPEKRAAMESEINNDPNTAELRKLYSKVLEQIKGFCPNLIDELGYKPWTPEVTARVQKWIDIVLEGNDPASSTDAPNAAATVNTENKGSEAKENKGSEAEYQSPAIDTGGDDTDDLPF